MGMALSSVSRVASGQEAPAGSLHACVRHWWKLCAPGCQRRIISFISFYCEEMVLNKLCLLVLQFHLFIAHPALLSQDAQVTGITLQHKARGCGAVSLAEFICSPG